MLTVESARAEVLGWARPLPDEMVPLAEAFGRVLAESVQAASCRPASDIAAMDGYAVRAGDLAAARPESPVRLRVVGLSRPGAPAEQAVGPGEAVRIFTGGCLPAGADAVVVQEATEADGEMVASRAAVAVGENVRGAGGEFRPGDLLLPAGSRLTPAGIGLLAAAGYRQVRVHRRPRVTLLVTGDELRLADAAGPDANGPMLRAALAEAGAEVLGQETCGDNLAAVTGWLTRQAQQADVLLTTGGASVGDYDLVPGAWEAAGVTACFHGVAMKPGKPVHFGRLGNALVFALPGTPLAALTGFEQFVAPALARLAGGDYQPTRLRLPTAEVYRTRRAATYLLRCERRDGSLRLPPRQDTAMLREAAQQPLTAVLPGQRVVPAGLPIEALAQAGALAGEVLRPAPPLPAVVAVRGASGSGKTRLIEQLIPRLRAAGLRLGYLKHTHHAVTMDLAGKDTARQAAAGAAHTLLLGAQGAAWFAQGEQLDQRPLGYWLELLAGEVELVVVEGLRAAKLAQAVVSVGQEFGLSSGWDDGCRCWRVTRPADLLEGHLDYPEALLAPLAEAWLAETREQRGEEQP